MHLQGRVAECEAFYLEATVERSTAGSYFMACGWNGGYFGIQEAREGKKVAIFSVWDSAKGDDPNAVTPEQRVELLHRGEGVRIKRFGGDTRREPELNAPLKAVAVAKRPPVDIPAEAFAPSTDSKPQ